MAAPSKETIEAILKDITGGMGLKKALTKHGVTEWYFFQEIDKDPIKIRAYGRAQEVRAELLAEEIVDISDEERDAQKARNRIDARKWYASKMKPSKFGDRIDLNLTQTVDIGAALQEAMQRAKLPERYPEPAIETQGTHIIEETPKAATDSQSVDGDASSNPAPDIFG